MTNKKPKYNVGDTLFVLSYGKISTLIKVASITIEENGVFYREKADCVAINYPEEDLFKVKNLKEFEKEVKEIKELIKKEKEKLDKIEKEKIDLLIKEWREND